MNPYWTTGLLLVCSNVFMTFAWYAHLKNMAQQPWVLAALASWGIALFEYLLQVPANRIGHNVMVSQYIAVFRNEESGTYATRNSTLLRLSTLATRTRLGRTLATRTWRLKVGTKKMSEHFIRILTTLGLSAADVDELFTLAATL